METTLTGCVYIAGTAPCTFPGHICHKAVNVGWDGASRPIIVLERTCGCRFGLDGKSLIRQCAKHFSESMQAAR